MDVNSYNQGHAAGVAEGRAPRHGEGLYDRLQLENEILSLKKRLAGLLAVKDLLREAVREVAPSHVLLNPERNNPRLLRAYTEAAANIKNSTDKI